MNKNRRNQTKIFPEKKDYKKGKMGLLLSVYSLPAITQTNKKTNKQTIYSFNDIQFPGLHIIQYYNIYNTVIIMMIII